VKLACTRLTRRRGIFTACKEKRDTTASTEERTSCWDDFTLPACMFFHLPSWVGRLPARSVMLELQWCAAWLKEADNGCASLPCSPRS